MTFESGAMTNCHRIIWGVFMLIVGLTLFIPREVLAHPMGNFSISHFTGIRIEAGAIDLRYILDLAEIPTFQEMQTSGIVPEPADPRVIAYLASKAEALKGGLAVALNGLPLPLEIVSEDVIFPLGAGNLPTMKIGVVYRAPIMGLACPCKLEYRDGNFTERAGWKEVVASAGPGATVVLSTAASVSRSQELANYPTDLINSPPQDLSATLTFALADGSARGGEENTPPRSPVDGLASSKPGRGDNALGETEFEHLSPTHAAGVLKLDPRDRVKAGARVSKPPGKGDVSSANFASTQGQPVPRPAAASTGKLALKANQQGTPRNSFTELIISNEWGLWFMLTAALIAAALGGLHALEPGHGKTIVAAYLVGSQGTAVHALILGLIVTVTHTAGVYALGLITLYASKYVVPDHLYPWLGFASGLTIAFLGLYLLARRLAGRHHAHGHHHHLHGVWGHRHDAGHSHGHTHNHTASGHADPHAYTHEHEHDHPQHGHDHIAPQDAHPHVHAHEHEHDHPRDAGSSQRAEDPFSYRQLVALGVTGGIVPCPAALVVLLSAISLHRVAFGLYLIVAFSLGLAAVLITIGMITVYARRMLSRLPTDGPLINRWLPSASATAITCLGVGIAAQALLALGVIHIRL